MSAHSFRNGAATESARLGWDGSVIIRLGRSLEDIVFMFVQNSFCLIVFIGFRGLNVWIVRHSFVFWAERQVAAGGYSVNLSFSSNLIFFTVCSVVLVRCLWAVVG